MATDASQIGGPSDLGKGIFGYRKAAVDQLIADRDLMLRQAEKRVRGSEVRIAELEKSLAESAERNARTDEQVRRLRQQFDQMAARASQVEQLAAQVQAEAQSMAAWSKRVNEIARAAAPSVARLRQLVDETPVLVEAALAPLAGKLPSLVGLLNEFARAVAPPQPVTRVG